MLLRGGAEGCVDSLFGVLNHPITGLTLSALEESCFSSGILPWSLSSLSFHPSSTGSCEGKLVSSLEHTTSQSPTFCERTATSSWVGGWEGGREGGREEGREGGREGGCEDVMDGGREGGREGGRRGEQ